VDPEGVRESLSGLILIVLVTVSAAPAQTRLALVKGDRVMALWEPGDKLLYKLEGDRKFREAFITDVRPHSLKTLNDSLALFDLRAVSLKGKGVGHFGQLVGRFLLVAGIGYPLVDLFNETVVQGNNYEPDDRVMTTSAIFIGTGAALILINPYGRKIQGRKRLIVVAPDSPYYRYF
jgi:hypothetical protein